MAGQRGRKGSLMRNHDGPHDGHDPIPGCDGCRFKANLPHISNSATPSRHVDRKPVIRPMKEPSWEKGVAGEKRPDGSFMPYINHRGSDIGVKQFAEQRSSLEAQRHRQLNDPNYGRNP